MANRLFISIAVLTFSLSTSAQQGRNYSMWYANEMQYNAAAVGTNYNDLKLFTNFRYQYFTVTDKPFQTISGAFEGKLLRNNANGYLGAGISFMNDMSGDGRYSVTQVSVPIAYHIQAAADHTISLGLQPGLYQRSISQGDLTWDNQWTGFEFSSDIPGEGIPNASVSNFDLGAGVRYKYQPDNVNKLTIGYGAQHILRPDLRFNIEDQLFLRHTAQIGGQFKRNLSSFGVSPQILAMFQGPNRNIMFGSNFDFYLQEPSLRTDFFQPTVFSFGVYHRLMDSFIANASFTIKGISIGASYDTNISILPASGTVGAFELYLAWDVIVNRRSKFIR